MNKATLLGILLLIGTIPILAQNSEWKTLNKSEYSVQFPMSWELNESGQMGTSFILFSPVSSNEDSFRENVNLIIQDISEYDLDLDQFVEISESQVKTMITEAKIKQSERVKVGAKEYHKVIYTGKQGILTLKFEQYYWVANNKAFVLTLTCEKSEFDTYQEVGEKILNSFQLN